MSNNLRIAEIANRKLKNAKINVIMDYRTSWYRITTLFQNHCQTNYLAIRTQEGLEMKNVNRTCVEKIIMLWLLRNKLNDKNPHIYYTIYLSSATAGGGGGKKDEVERFYNKTSHAYEPITALCSKETFREFAAARLSAFLSLFWPFLPTHQDASWHKIKMQQRHVSIAPIRHFQTFGGSLNVLSLCGEIENFLVWSLLWT